MIKDIVQNSVEGIAVAVVKELNETGETIWNVYLINLKKEKIEDVLISSDGYGNIDGEEVKTSTLRHYIGDVEANDFAKIEPIIDNLFMLNNQYWLSFYQRGHIYEKKYIFYSGSINEDNFVMIPYINKTGVMIA